MKRIIAGIVLIGIGFSLGGSICLGNFGVVSFVFGGLGLFWIGKGLCGIGRAEQQQSHSRPQRQLRLEATPCPAPSPHLHGVTNLAPSR